MFRDLMMHSAAQGIYPRDEDAFEAVPADDFFNEITDGIHGDVVSSLNEGYATGIPYHELQDLSLYPDRHAVPGFGLMRPGYGAIAYRVPVDISHLNPQGDIGRDKAISIEPGAVTVDIAGLSRPAYVLMQGIVPKDPSNGHLARPYIEDKIKSSGGNFLRYSPSSGVLMFSVSGFSKHDLEIDAEDSPVEYKKARVLQPSPATNITFPSDGRRKSRSRSKVQYDEDFGYDDFEKILAEQDEKYAADLASGTLKRGDSDESDGSAGKLKRGDSDESDDDSDDSDGFDDEDEDLQLALQESHEHQQRGKDGKLKRGDSDDDDDVDWLEDDANESKKQSTTKKKGRRSSKKSPATESEGKLKGGGDSDESEDEAASAGRWHKSAAKKNIKVSSLSSKELADSFTSQSLNNPCLFLYHFQRKFTTGQTYRRPMPLCRKS